MRFLLLLALVACTVPPEQRARDVCTAFCDCFEPVSSEVPACVEDCVPDIGTISDDCLTCIYSHSQMCSTLFDDCEPMCSSQPPGV